MPVKVTIFGAGSVVFSLGLVKDICLTEDLGGSTVCFMDINEDRLNVIHRLGERYAEDLGADIKFESTSNREESFKDADFVVNTATITHNEYFMKRRRELTDKYGYFFGNTGMPEYHNLQLMLDVARDMERICPEAWMLLAGNPVFDGTTLMTRETDVKICGLCHGHYGYKTVAKTIGLDPDLVKWQAPGLNHKIWLTHFYVGETNAYPLLDAWINEKSQAFWEDCEKNKNGIPLQMSPSAIHQYAKFGLMPIGDTPRGTGWWYSTDLKTRERWYGEGGGKDTPAGRDQVLKNKEEKYKQMKSAASNGKTRPVDLFGDQKTPEQHIPIIDGLVNDNEGQFQVNIPNRGALPGIPDDVAVEVPAIVNKIGIQPIQMPPLPKKILLESIYPTWLRMERTLEAVKTGDKSMLLYSILDNPKTHSYKQATDVLDALFEIDPNEPMAYVEDINRRFNWPPNWPSLSRNG